MILFQSLSTAAVTIYSLTMAIATLPLPWCFVGHFLIYSYHLVYYISFQSLAASSELGGKPYWDWRTGSRNHEIRASDLASVHWPTHPKNRSNQLNRNRRSQSKRLFVSTSKSMAYLNPLGTDKSLTDHPHIEIATVERPSIGRPGT